MPGAAAAQRFPPPAPPHRRCRLPTLLALSLPPQLYALFGKYGAIRQIRVGNSKDTRGTAYIVYEDIFDAKTAVDHLSGFNVQVRGAAGSSCGGWQLPWRRRSSRRAAHQLPGHATALGARAGVRRGWSRRQEEGNAP